MWNMYKCKGTHQEQSWGGQITNIMLEKIYLMIHKVNIIYQLNNSTVLAENQEKIHQNSTPAILLGYTEYTCK